MLQTVAVKQSLWQPLRGCSAEIEVPMPLLMTLQQQFFACFLVGPQDQSRLKEAASLKAKHYA
jgi:hypothetical protein